MSVEGDLEHHALRAELAHLYRGLAPAEPADALEDTDASTRASVAWMQRAWATLEVPRSARLPGRRTARPSLRRRAVLALAAAAVIAGLGLALWRPWESRPAQETPVVSQGEALPASPTGEREIRLASLSSDHIEMRSGPVRLVLYTGPGEN
jgi:ferric-dicitrate binding protein FerR (iron transport regulator)